MTPDELVTILEQHARYLRRQHCAVRANLAMQNLSGLDLSNADLREAKLTGANLKHCILKGANLGDADLFATDISGADLGDADHFPMQPAGRFFARRQSRRREYEKSRFARRLSVDPVKRQ